MIYDNIIRDGDVNELRGEKMMTASCGTDLYSDGGIGWLPDLAIGAAELAFCACVVAGCLSIAVGYASMLGTFLAMGNIVASAGALLAVAAFASLAAFPIWLGCAVLGMLADAVSVIAGSAPLAWRRLLLFMGLARLDGVRVEMSDDGEAIALSTGGHAARIAIARGGSLEIRPSRSRRARVRGVSHAARHGGRVGAAHMVLWLPGDEACMLRGALVAHRDGCPAGDVVSACGGGTGALRIAVG